MHDVICIGSATMDAFIETEKNTATVQQVDGRDQPFITYRSGEKILIKHLQFEVGGGGTNTAVCFARLGLHTAYVGNVGKDLNGDQVLKLLAHEHVDFLGTTSEDLTNYSIVLESSLLKDRTILVYKGASERLLYPNVPGIFCKYLYVSSLAGESFRTAKRIMENVKPMGTVVAFNPSNYQIESDRASVLEMIKLSNIIVMNREEAVLLVGEVPEKDLLEKLRALGPSIVVVTMGGKGVMVMNAQGEWWRAYPSQGIPIKDTTGAGDCFASTFVAALAYEKSFDDAIRWAMVNVENHIQHVGAKAGLLTKSEIQFAVLQDNRVMQSSQGNM
jgi:ribokinase